MRSYHRPTVLDDALRARAAGPCAVLAGGTDFYPARVGRTIEEDVLDITALTELRGVREEAGHFRIGALTTWTDLLEATLPAWFTAVKLAAREVGGIQIQNAGTVAGNLCNASPAADGVPPLLAFDARVELHSVRGTRTLPLREFIQGNRKTACAADELLTAVLVPKWGDRARSTFLKLGARKYLVISIAMVAAVVETDAQSVIARCGIAVGACSAAAQRLHAIEAALVGRTFAPGIGAAVRPEHLASLAPITDVRATAAYRADAVGTLVARALEELAREQAG
ncbi:MAG TPA: FAD binding domain-containing protein [Burkholderiales bacterium]|nr:FAD binding domain-containing protein [Burkholderiales bacterium]